MPAPWGASGVAGGEAGSRVKGGRGVSLHAAHWWFSRARPWTTPVHRVPLGTVTRGTFLSPGWCSRTRKSRPPQGPPGLLRRVPRPCPRQPRPGGALGPLAPAAPGPSPPVVCLCSPSFIHQHPPSGRPLTCPGLEFSRSPPVSLPSLRPSLRPHQPGLQSRGLSASLLHGLPLRWKGTLPACWVWPFMLPAGPRPKQGW